MEKLSVCFKPQKHIDEQILVRGIHNLVSIILSETTLYCAPDLPALEKQYLLQSISSLHMHEDGCYPTLRIKWEKQGQYPSVDWIHLWSYGLAALAKNNEHVLSIEFDLYNGDLVWSVK